MSLKTDLRADSILLLTAFIWGLAFVYQRTGMDHIGPITFTFGRFFIGALAILPLWYLMEKPTQIFAVNRINKKAALLGLVLTAGMLLQQWGMVYTHCRPRWFPNRGLHYFCANHRYIFSAIKPSGRPGSAWLWLWLGCSLWGRWKVTNYLRVIS